MEDFDLANSHFTDWLLTAEKSRRGCLITEVQEHLALLGFNDGRMKCALQQFSQRTSVPVKKLTPKEVSMYTQRYTRHSASHYDTFRDYKAGCDFAPSPERIGLATTQYDYDPFVLDYGIYDERSVSSPSSDRSTTHTSSRYDNDPFIDYGIYSDVSSTSERRGLATTRYDYDPFVIDYGIYDERSVSSSSYDRSTTYTSSRYDDDPFIDYGIYSDVSSTSERMRLNTSRYDHNPFIDFGISNEGCHFGPSADRQYPLHVWEKYESSQRANRSRRYECDDSGRSSTSSEYYRVNERSSTWKDYKKRKFNRKKRRVYSYDDNDRLQLAGSNEDDLPEKKKQKSISVLQESRKPNYSGNEKQNKSKENFSKSGNVDNAELHEKDYVERKERGSSEENSENTQQANEAHSHTPCKVRTTLLERVNVMCEQTKKSDMNLESLVNNAVSKKLDHCLQTFLQGDVAADTESMDETPNKAVLQTPLQSQSQVPSHEDGSRSETSVRSSHNEPESTTPSDGATEKGTVDMYPAIQKTTNCDTVNSSKSNVSKSDVINSSKTMPGDDNNTSLKSVLMKQKLDENRNIHKNLLRDNESVPNEKISNEDKKYAKKTSLSGHHKLPTDDQNSQRTVHSDRLIDDRLNCHNQEKSHEKCASDGSASLVSSSDKSKWQKDVKGAGRLPSDNKSSSHRTDPDNKRNSSDDHVSSLKHVSSDSDTSNCSNSTPAHKHEKSGVRHPSGDKKGSYKAMPDHEKASNGGKNSSHKNVSSVSDDQIPSCTEKSENRKHVKSGERHPSGDKNSSHKAVPGHEKTSNDKDKSENRKHIKNDDRRQSGDKNNSHQSLSSSEKILHDDKDTNENIPSVRKIPNRDSNDQSCSSDKINTHKHGKSDQKSSANDKSSSYKSLPGVPEHQSDNSSDSHKTLPSVQQHSRSNIKNAPSSTLDKSKSQKSLPALVDSNVEVTSRKEKTTSTSSHADTSERVCGMSNSDKINKNTALQKVSSAEKNSIHKSCEDFLSDSMRPHTKVSSPSDKVKRTSTSDVRTHQDVGAGDDAPKRDVKFDQEVHSVEAERNLKQCDTKPLNKSEATRRTSSSCYVSILEYFDHSPAKSDSCNNDNNPSACKNLKRKNPCEAFPGKNSKLPALENKEKDVPKTIKKTSCTELATKKEGNLKGLPTSRISVPKNRDQNSVEKSEKKLSCTSPTKDRPPATSMASSKSPLPSPTEIRESHAKEDNSNASHNSNRAKPSERTSGKQEKLINANTYSKEKTSASSDTNRLLGLRHMKPEHQKKSVSNEDASQAQNVRSGSVENMDHMSQNSSKRSLEGHKKKDSSSELKQKSTKTKKRRSSEPLSSSVIDHNRKERRLSDGQKQSSSANALEESADEPPKKISKLERGKNKSSESRSTTTLSKIESKKLKMRELFGDDEVEDDESSYSDSKDSGKPPRDPSKDSGKSSRDPSKDSGKSSRDPSKDSGKSSRDPSKKSGKSSRDPALLPQVEKASSNIEPIVMIAPSSNNEQNIEINMNNIDKIFPGPEGSQLVADTSRKGVNTTCEMKLTKINNSEKNKSKTAVNNSRVQESEGNSVGPPSVGATEKVVEKPTSASLQEGKQSTSTAECTVKEEVQEQIPSEEHDQEDNDSCRSNTIVTNGDLVGRENADRTILEQQENNLCSEFVSSGITVKIKTDEEDLTTEEDPLTPVVDNINPTEPEKNQSNESVSRCVSQLTVADNTVPMQLENRESAEETPQNINSEIMATMTATALVTNHITPSEVQTHQQSNLNEPPVTLVTSSSTGTSAQNSTEYPGRSNQLDASLTGITSVGNLVSHTVSNLFASEENDGRQSDSNLNLRNLLASSTSTTTTDSLTCNSNVVSSSVSEQHTFRIRVRDPASLGIGVSQNTNEGNSGKRTEADELNVCRTANNEVLPAVEAGVPESNALRNSNSRDWPASETEGSVTSEAAINHSVENPNSQNFSFPYFNDVLQNLAAITYSIMTDIERYFTRRTIVGRLKESLPPTEMNLAIKDLFHSVTSKEKQFFEHYRILRNTLKNNAHETLLKRINEISKNNNTKIEDLERVIGYMFAKKAKQLSGGSQRVGLNGPPPPPDYTGPPPLNIPGNVTVNRQPEANMPHQNPLQTSASNIISPREAIQAGNPDGIPQNNVYWRQQSLPSDGSLRHDHRENSNVERTNSTHPNILSTAPEQNQSSARFGVHVPSYSGLGPYELRRTSQPLPSASYAGDASRTADSTLYMNRSGAPNVTIQSNQEFQQATYRPDQAPAIHNRVSSQSAVGGNQLPSRIQPFPPVRPSAPPNYHQWDQNRLAFHPQQQFQGVDYGQQRQNLQHKQQQEQRLQKQPQQQLQQQRLQNQPQQQLQNQPQQRLQNQPQQQLQQQNQPQQQLQQQRLQNQSQQRLQNQPQQQLQQQRLQNQPQQLQQNQQQQKQHQKQPQQIHQQPHQSTQRQLQQNPQHQQLHQSTHQLQQNPQHQQLHQSTHQLQQNPQHQQLHQSTQQQRLQHVQQSEEQLQIQQNRQQLQMPNPQHHQVQQRLPTQQQQIQNIMNPRRQNQDIMLQKENQSSHSSALAHLLQYQPRPSAPSLSHQQSVFPTYSNTGTVRPQINTQLVQPTVVSSRVQQYQPLHFPPPGPELLPVLPPVQVQQLMQNSQSSIPPQPINISVSYNNERRTYAISGIQLQHSAQDVNLGNLTSIVESVIPRSTRNSVDEYQNILSATSSANQVIASGAIPVTTHNPPAPPGYSQQIVKESLSREGQMITSNSSSQLPSEGVSKNHSYRLNQSSQLGNENRTVPNILQRKDSLGKYPPDVQATNRASQVPSESFSQNQTLGLRRSGSNSSQLSSEDRCSQNIHPPEIQRIATQPPSERISQNQTLALRRSGSNSSEPCSEDRSAPNIHQHEIPPPEIQRIATQPPSERISQIQTLVLRRSGSNSSQMWSVERSPQNIRQKEIPPPETQRIATQPPSERISQNQTLERIATQPPSERISQNQTLALRRSGCNSSQPCSEDRRAPNIHQHEIPPPKIQRIATQPPSERISQNQTLERIATQPPSERISQNQTLALRRSGSNSSQPCSEDRSAPNIHQHEIPPLEMQRIATQPPSERISQNQTLALRRSGCNSSQPCSEDRRAPNIHQHEIPPPKIQRIATQPPSERISQNQTLGLRRSGSNSSQLCSEDGSAPNIHQKEIPPPPEMQRVATTNVSQASSKSVSQNQTSRQRRSNSKPSQLSNHDVHAPDIRQRNSSVEIPPLQSDADSVLTSQELQRESSASQLPTVQREATQVSDSAKDSTSSPPASMIVQHSSGKETPPVSKLRLLRKPERRVTPRLENEKAVENTSTKDISSQPPVENTNTQPAGEVSDSSDSEPVIIEDVVVIDDDDDDLILIEDDSDDNPIILDDDPEAVEGDVADLKAGDVEMQTEVITQPPRTVSTDSGYMTPWRERGAEDDFIDLIDVESSPTYPEIESMKEDKKMEDYDTWFEAEDNKVLVPDDAGESLLKWHEMKIGDLPESDKCAVCDKPAEVLCLGCHDRYFCSKDCQLTDWRDGHHIVCLARIK